jgi:hypothetical protein
MRTTDGLRLTASGFGIRIIRDIKKCEVFQSADRPATDRGLQLTASG